MVRTDPNNGIVTLMTIKAVVFDAYGTLYDVQSVAAVTDEAFPGYGEIITQIWRMKQLEYTWLRSLMGRYEDFSSHHARSLAYSCVPRTEEQTPSVFDRIMDKYVHLDLYPDAKDALAALKGHKLAILSNGAPICSTRLFATPGSTGFWMPPSASTRKESSSRARRPTR